jgi:formyl-CoA transferase
MRAIGRSELIDHPDWATPQARLPRLDECFAMVEEWTMTKTKFEVMNILTPENVPCGPILTMKELADEPALRETGTIVELDHPTRGKYKTIGNPIKLSDSPVEVTRSPLLGEHTDEVLREIVGLSEDEIRNAREHGAI